MTSARTLLPVLLALLLAAAPAHAGEAAAEDPAAAKARAAVEAGLAYLDGTPKGSARALASLKRLGTREYGTLLEMAYVAREGTPEGDILARAVRAHGSRRLEDHLARSLRGSEPDRARVAALQRIARFGGPDQLPFAVKVVSGIDGTWLPTKRVTATWEGAWRRVTAGKPFRRDLRTALTDLPRPLRTPSARILAARSDAEALGAVVDAAVAEPEEAAELLVALGRSSRLMLHRAGGAAAVDARDPAVRRAAASLAARVRALEAFDDLVVRLDDDDAGVRRASLRSLRSLTGAAVGKDVAAWERWAQDQRARAARFDERGLGDLDDLRALSLRMQEVVRHPFAAAGLVPDVIRLLGHGNPHVAGLAAATLGRLGSFDAGKALAERVEDPDPTVAAAAQRALVQLTGETHEATTHAWLRALGA